MPAAHQAASSGRCEALRRGQIHKRLITSRPAASAQRDSSMTWPRLEVVSTEYQEKSSATAMSGTTTRAVTRPTPLPVAFDISLSRRAHCAAKHSSAKVATDRPTITLESQVSKRQKRWMSYTGSTERYAQPST